MLGPTGVLADLICWGRDGHEWFALVVWTVYGNTAGGNAYLHQSAWVPAPRVVQSADPGVQVLYSRVERLDLPPDRSRWPTPAASRHRRWLHHGVLSQPGSIDLRDLVNPIPQPRRD